MLPSRLARWTLATSSLFLIVGCSGESASDTQTASDLNLLAAEEEPAPESPYVPIDIIPVPDDDGNQSPIDEVPAEEIAEVEVQTPSSPTKGSKSPAQSPNQSPIHSPTQSPGQKPIPVEPQELMDLVITQLTATGTGCPVDSISSNVAPDGRAFTVLFAEFFNELTSGKSSSTRIDCRIALNLDVPAGYRFSIASTDVRGFADLEEDTMAEILASYSFAGRSIAGSTQGGTALKGPFQDDYTLSHEYELATRSYSTCGESQTLYIDLSTVIRRSSLDALAALTVDSVDGEFKSTTGVQWHSCSE